jgi:hypothetical protein
LWKDIKALSGLNLNREEARPFTFPFPYKVSQNRKFIFHLSAVYFGIRKF